jgi:hypothetical protein
MPYFTPSTSQETGRKERLHPFDFGAIVHLSLRPLAESRNEGEQVIFDGRNQRGW